jgi:hypothetical protein
VKVARKPLGDEMKLIPRNPEVQHSPSGMKQVGVVLHVAGLGNPLHFPLGHQWRWFYAGPKALLQVLDGGHVVAEADAGMVTIVYGPAWTSPIQRSPERP